MAVDPRIYEQQMMNFDFANPSSSTMVGRDALAARSMPTAEQARAALMDSQREQAAAQGGARAAYREMAERPYRQRLAADEARKKRERKKREGTVIVHGEGGARELD